ncbi:MAG: hypothetical protein ACFFEV_09170 [Candidatus Thorarchaeota archaeon]
MGKLTELLFQVNSAALVEALLEMGINPDIMTTIIAGRFNELRPVIFEQLGNAVSDDGARQELPSDISALIQFYTKLAADGGIFDLLESESVSESGYTLIGTNCMFKSTRNILMARHPDLQPPCFVAAMLAGIASGVTGKQCMPDSVEINGDKCKFKTVVE